MSETAIVAICIALIGGIPPTLMAWATFRQTKITTKKADVIIEKAVEIKTSTDGQLTKLNEDLKAANAKVDVSNEKIIGLEKLIANMIPGRNVK